MLAVDWLELFSGKSGLGVLCGLCSREHRWNDWGHIWWLYYYIILSDYDIFDSHVTAVCNHHMWTVLPSAEPATTICGRCVTSVGCCHMTWLDRTLACSIVITRLDYCNSLMYNTSNRNLAKLQRVQNTLARVVLQVPRLTHATPLLRSLHWLPGYQRATFKLDVITNNVKKTSMPSYLHNLLNDWCTSSSMCPFITSTVAGNSSMWNWLWPSCFQCCCRWKLEQTFDRCPVIW